MTDEDSNPWTGRLMQLGIMFTISLAVLGTVVSGHKDSCYNSVYSQFPSYVEQCLSDIQPLQEYFIPIAAGIAIASYGSLELIAWYLSRGDQDGS